MPRQLPNFPGVSDHVQDMPESHITLSDNFSEGPVSVNTLRLALCTIKERCQRQQRRIEELERDNDNIRQSRSDLYKEVKKLHESNMKLREKNLQLNQRLHLKSKENVDVRDQLSSLQDQHSHSIRQLERLQNEVSALVTVPRSASTQEISKPLEEVTDVQSLHETNAKLREENFQLNQKLQMKSEENMDVKDQLLSLQDQHSHSIRQLRKFHNDALDQLPRSASMCEVFSPLEVPISDVEMQSLGIQESQSQMNMIKTKVLEQQILLKTAMAELGSRVKVKEEQVKSMIEATQANQSNTKEEASYKQCPMCEAEFSLDTPHEQFEAHVVDHFSYEESETLRNFDLVPDAFV